MRRSPLAFCLLAGVALVASASTSLAQQALAQPANAASPELQEVARFDHQVTGVTVAKYGRIFVNFPRVGDNGPSDGFLIDRRGRMYISAVEDNAVKVWKEDRVSILIRDERLRWPDTFAEGPDGAIYVTSSRIQDSAIFKPDAPPSLAPSCGASSPRATPRAPSGRGARRPGSRAPTISPHQRGAIEHD